MRTTWSSVIRILGMCALVVAHGSDAGSREARSSSAGPRLVVQARGIGTVWSVVASRDGSRVASLEADGTSQRVHVWDAATGLALRSVVFDSRLPFLALSPDGRQLAIVRKTSDDAFATGAPRELVVVDVDTGVVRPRLGLLRTKATALAFSPDGEMVYVGQDLGTILAFSLRSPGKHRWRAPAHDAEVTDLVCCEEPGCIFSSSLDGTIARTRLGGRTTEVVDRAPTGITALALAPGLLVSGTEAGELRLHRLDDPRRSDVIWHAEETSIRSVALDRTGSTLAATTEARARAPALWHLEGGVATPLPAAEDNPPLWASEVACAANGVVVAGSGDDLWAWDAGTAAYRGRFGCALQTLRQVGLTADQRFLAVLAWKPTAAPSWSRQPRVEVWDVLAGRHSLSLVPKGRATSVAVHPTEPRVLIGCDDGHAEVRSLYTGDLELLVEGVQGGIRCVSWSSDGRLLAAGGEEGHVHLWRASDGKPLGPLAGHTGPVHGVVFQPGDQHLLSTQTDGHTRLWNIEEMRCTRELETPRGSPVGAWSSDGESVIVRQDEQAVRCRVHAGSGRISDRVPAEV
ncbi:MAG: hypothetical protein KDB73_19455, partial [Planctomycetes bacterium]|nr:hypothetical protein [Planctomycetota bacterium]